MFSYTDTFLVVGLDGEEFELNQCRIDNKQKVFTKDISVTVQSGSKLIRKNNYGLDEYYFVTSVNNKPNLLGSIEIQITPV